MIKQQIQRCGFSHGQPLGGAAFISMLDASPEAIADLVPGKSWESLQCFVMNRIVSQVGGDLGYTAGQLNFYQSYKVLNVFVDLITCWWVRNILSSRLPISGHFYLYFVGQVWRCFIFYAGRIAWEPPLYKGSH